MIPLLTTTISDAWHQAVYACYNEGYDYTINSGSFEGGKRRQLDFLVIEVRHPEIRPLSVQIPEHIELPPISTEEQVNEYAMKYLLSNEISKNELYTYGGRMWGPRPINQIDDILTHFKDYPYNNHCCIMIAKSTDLSLKHAPCLRLVDLKIVDNKLNITLYFRSWDLWSGLPVNLGGFQIFNEYIACELNIETGKMFACSAGAHLYHMCFPMYKIRFGT